HSRAGGPHAEVEALREAGDLAMNSTLHVTLEPCNHTGRTPPCTEAIVRAGVTEVSYAVRDPNPSVSGSGHEYLENAGLVVHEGLCGEEARHLNRFYIHAVRTGRPYVVAKFAMSLDGKIATRSGESRWITGADARAEVHKLRSVVDAVLVGAGTAISDNPLLTARMEGYEGSQPRRIVLDSHGRVPIESAMFDSESSGGSVVATTDAMPEEHRRALEKLGVEVWTFPRTGSGQVKLSVLLDELGNRGTRSLLVEGGADVFGSFFDKGHVQELWAFVAPIIIGGPEALSPVHGNGVPRPSKATRLGKTSLERFGDDVLIRGYVIQSSRVEKENVHGNC
ncbi:MAG: bifunctional diaminohydroxyphosphoribosylaminopyrimidine deaminase/5-amino-6-(5-phosphoribosylamino)uracil reductase RibD, partial [Bacteroidetes bacterium]